MDQLGTLAGDDIILEAFNVEAVELDWIVDVRVRDRSSDDCIVLSILSQDTGWEVSMAT
jgi:hypothetical protein